MTVRLVSHEIKSLIIYINRPHKKGRKEINIMKRTLIVFMVIIASTALTAGIVNAAAERNITSRLGGVAGDIFSLDGTLKVSALKVGAQSVGGVTYFNGTIINNTTNSTGADNPVTFGDNVRIDGRVYRGIVAGTSDSLPFIVNDNMEVMGNLTVDGGLTIGSDETLTMGSSSVINLTNATVQGLSTADLSDGTVLTKTNAVATLTSDWINTAYPWAANEIADVVRSVPIPLSGLYTDADGTPAAITSGTTPSLNYTANQGLFLQYAATQTTDIGGQFIVPSDYASGGVLKVVADKAGTKVTNDWKLDFKAAISQTTGTAAWATSMANETPVTVTDNPGKPSAITLTPTSQSDISAGDVVYFDIWPDTATDTTAEPNLEIYSIWFEYTATQ